MSLDQRLLLAHGTVGKSGCHDAAHAAMITQTGANHIVGVWATVPRWFRILFALGRHVTTIYVLPCLWGSIRQLLRSNTDDRAVRGVQLADLGMPFACHIPESIGN